MRVSLNVLPMPKSVDHYNANNERCDILNGPCACGAWHSIDEWSLRRLADGTPVSEIPEVKEKITFYKEIVSRLTQEKDVLESFFETLQWQTLRQRIYEALENPDKSVPLKINCPAVKTIVASVMEGVASSALNNPGQEISQDDQDKMDLHVLVMRILESIISCAEEFRDNDSRYITVVDK